MSPFVALCDGTTRRARLRPYPISTFTLANRFGRVARHQGTERVAQCLGFAHGFSSRPPTRSLDDEPKWCTRGHIAGEASAHHREPARQRAAPPPGPALTVPLLRSIDAEDLSPYLAQHAHNPVDWWTWGEDALGEATRRDCPIFLSVGYAACHWCHVMAHESFEDPALARQLNENFVAVKVDREERPDLDHLYMAATQLISGQGGWPMSVFLLSDGRPFSAGTYYPPTDRHGRVGFATLLETMDQAWRSRRGDVEEQARAVEKALSREIAFVEHLAPRIDALDLASARRALAAEIASATDVDGGQSEPRFPRAGYVDALVADGSAVSLAAAQRILTAMSRRGLFDHVGGGFARYSVDARWHVPHFEKMLSDQALLSRTYFTAARIGEEFAAFGEVGRRTVTFVQRELRVEHGYAASLDADAAGVEGSHVTWTPQEVHDALAAVGLGAHSAEVLLYLSIGPEGDLEGRSVPRLGEDAPFDPPAHLREALRELFAARARRPQPTRDDKVILEWNAMFAGALLASRDETMVEDALALLHSLQNSHFVRGHWWRTQATRDYATSADVAWVVDAYLDAYEVAGEDAWLTRAYDIARYLVEHYWDGPVPSARSAHDGQGLFSTSDQCGDLFRRPKEIFDGATPSGHAVATRALARLALCLGDEDLLAIAERLVALGGELIATHPRSVPDLVLAAGYCDGVEVVIPGDSNNLRHHVRSIPMLRGVLITGSGSSPLLSGRQSGLAYVCHAGACQRPVSSVAELNDVLSGAF